MFSADGGTWIMTVVRFLGRIAVDFDRFSCDCLFEFVSLWLLLGVGVREDFETDWTGIIASRSTSLLVVWGWFLCRLRKSFRKMSMNQKSVTVVYGMRCNQAHQSEYAKTSCDSRQLHEHTVFSACCFTNWLSFRWSVFNFKCLRMLTTSLIIRAVRRRRQRREMTARIQEEDERWLRGDDITKQEILSILQEMPEDVGVNDIDVL